MVHYVKTVYADIFKEESMMAYRLIIVDDEKEISTGFAQFFPWNSLGYDMVACFTDARSALDYLRQHPIDVVVSDVIMPGFTGLDLARTISEEEYDIQPHVLLFSAYDTFEYAQAAVRYRCTDYVLKSVEYDELIDIFTKLKIKLDQERRPHQEDSSQALRYNLPGTALHDNIISTIADYVEKNLPGACLEEVADLVYMSPTYVSHYFKRKTGYSFSDYLWTRKMIVAGDMLTDIQYKIYEVGDRLGYKKPANFTRAFKKFYHLSPKEYRYRKMGRILPEDEAEDL